MDEAAEEAFLDWRRPVQENDINFGNTEVMNSSSIDGSWIFSRNNDDYTIVI